MMNKTYSAVFLACMGLGLAGCNDSDDAQTITSPPVIDLEYDSTCINTYTRELLT
jgi:hypothetical protein